MAAAKTIPARRDRVTAEESVQIAALQAPSHPPARIEAADKATTLNLRLRESTVAAITRAARERRLTIKQLIMQAAESHGIAVAPADLEDRTPRRRSTGT